MSGAVAALAGMTYSRPVYLQPSLTVVDVDSFGTAVAVFSIKADGTYTSVGSSPSNPSGTWLLAGTAVSYEVRFTPTSGSVSAGSSATSTWLPLSSDRSWQKESTFDLQEVIGTFELRNASTLQLFLSSVLTLQAIGPL